MRYQFHVNFYARPAEIGADSNVTLRGIELPTLRARAWDAFLPIGFDDAIAALARLPRLDAEPDGFFVVAGDDAHGRWQVDGHLYDFGERLHRVELHGECPLETLDALLGCVGWPATPLVCELVMEGVALEEAAFRRWAVSPRSLTGG